MASASDWRAGRGGRGGRGRGKRDHRRGRAGHGAASDAAVCRRNRDEPHGKKNEEEEVEEEEEKDIFTRRKLQSNWERYREPEEGDHALPSHRGADYYTLLASAGDSFSQFRFSEEKEWQTEALASLQIPALSLDLPALSQRLQELPLHTRLNLELEDVQTTTPLDLPHTLHVSSGLRPTCIVKSVPDVPPVAEDADEELELLLNLQTSPPDSRPVLSALPAPEEEEERQEEVEAESRQTRKEVTEEDLEDWLDSVIS